MKRSVIFTLSIIMFTACINATLLTGCDSNGDSTPPTPIVSPSPTNTPTVTVTPTVIPTPGTPTPTDTPTPTPEIPQDVLDTLKYLDNYNLELVEFLKQQPWYNDGIDAGERIFINDGLGEGIGYQGIGFVSAENDILIDIVKEKKYSITKIQMMGGEKNLLLIVQDKAMLEKYQALAEDLVPRHEASMGVMYPLETFIIYIRDNGIHGAANGTVFLNSSRFSAIYLSHEIDHAIWDTQTAGGLMGAATEPWIMEGFAESYGLHDMEDLTVEGSELIKRDYDVQEYYDAKKNILIEDKGTWDAPIEDNSVYNSLGYDRMGGLLCVEDLRNLVGDEALKKARADLYRFKDENVDVLAGVRKIDGHDLLNSVLKYTENDAEVKQFFEERIFLSRL